MKADKEKLKYEYALGRIEDLLPKVTEEMPADDPLTLELAIMSDVVIAYESVHFPIEKPTVAELIQLSLEDKGMTQKQLASEIGVSPARINDYVSGRAEPTLRIARLICSTLSISPSLLLGL